MPVRTPIQCALILVNFRDAWVFVLKYKYNVPSLSGIHMCNAMITKEGRKKYIKGMFSVNHDNSTLWIEDTISICEVSTTIYNRAAIHSPSNWTSIFIHDSYDTANVE